MSHYMVCYIYEEREFNIDEKAFVYLSLKSDCQFLAFMIIRWLTRNLFSHL